MWQYYLFFALLFIGYFVLGGYNSSVAVQHSRQSGKVYLQYLALVSLALWFLIGLRDVLIGRDTLGYVQYFMESTSLSTNELKENAEPLFQLFTTACRSITDNYHIYLLLASSSMCYALYCLFKKFFNTNYEILAAICIYVLLGILSFNMAGIRQTIAMSFGIFAFLLLNDGKWIKSLLLIGIAYFFHNSSIIYLVMFSFYFINYRKVGVWLLILMIGVSVFASYYISSFLETILTTSDRFAHYDVESEGQSYVALVLQIILIVVAWRQKDKIGLNEKAKNTLFLMAFVGAAIQSTSGVLFEMFRMSFYFSIFDIVLIPLALSSVKGENASLIRAAFIIGCLLYIFVIAGGDATLPHPQEYQTTIK